VKLVDEDFDGHLHSSRTKLRQDVRCNVVDVDDIVELETVGVHVLFIVILRLVDLVDDHCGVTIDK
jgi:hypothetical protein